MRPEQPWVQPDASDPFRYEARILARCQVAVGTTTTSEQELAGPLVGSLQIVIDGLAGLLAQFKSDRPPGFLLPDGCAIRRVTAGSDILDPDGNDITPTKLAVYCQIEHGQVANATFDLELCPDRPNVFGRSGGFAPVSLPLFHGTRLGAGVAFT
jgi:hypothetical protein